MENLVGRKIKGFEFEAKFSLCHYDHMNEYIGQIGIIEKVNENDVRVEFKDENCFYYPLDQIQPHLIPLEVFKLGQKVWDKSISDEAGEVVNIDSGDLVYPIEIKFISGNTTYTIDGRLSSESTKTLSTTPYTFQGFSQETIIERGTVVYVRNYEEFSWEIGFYDEFKDNDHFVFVGQQKEGDSNPWTFCQTKNPLI